MNALWLPASVLMLMQLGAVTPGQVVADRDRSPRPPRTVLYTSVLYAPYNFSRAECTVVNTSDDAVAVSIELLNDDGKGVPLENPPHQPIIILPQTAGGISSPGVVHYDGTYCRFSFSGNKEAIRAVLEVFSQPDDSSPVITITSEAR